MKKLLHRILINYTTRIIFIIYLFFIIITSFFIVFGYYNDLNLQKEKHYSKLFGIVSSIASNIDGDHHEIMVKQLVLNNDSIHNNPIYNTIQAKLNKAVEINELNSAMYTLIFNAEEKRFFYGVRSDEYVDFGNEYIQTPEVLIQKLNKGGIIPYHKSENGTWLSAFYPIFNQKGDLSAVLEADMEFSGFIKQVRGQYYKRVIFILLFVIILFIFFILYTRKILIEEASQRRLLSHQKKIIEIKNKGLMDSIRYAYKIQNAMLPSLTNFELHFKDSFVFYQSKDIVAGDFYWLEKVDGQIYVAVADCTGHGVPGAILSIVCSNALNNVICEMKITEPGKILDEARNIVINFLTKGDHEMNDGMDIALCKIDVVTMKLEYAGAYNPAYIVRDKELIITSACKQPVGRFIKQKDFKSTTFKLNEGDKIYLFTDGFADQFGGPRTKKYKYKQFKELILSNAKKSMVEQKEVIFNAFYNWKGDEEQIDDVCVVGITV